MILSDATLDKLREVATELITVDLRNEREQNWDDLIRVYNQIKQACGLEDDELQQVGRLIEAAGDPEFRSPM